MIKSTVDHTCSNTASMSTRGYNRWFTLHCYTISLLSRLCYSPPNERCTYARWIDHHSIRQTNIRKAPDIHEHVTSCWMKFGFTRLTTRQTCREQILASKFIRLGKLYTACFLVVEPISSVIDSANKQNCFMRTGLIVPMNNKSYLTSFVGMNKKWEYGNVNYFNSHYEIRHFDLDSKPEASSILDGS